MDNQQVAQFIRQLRKSKQMTQKELADKLCITDKAISKWERGLGCPDISLLPSLANELGVTVEEILSGHRILPICSDSEKTNEASYTEFESVLDRTNSVAFIKTQNVKKIIFIQTIIACVFGFISILLTLLYICTSWEQAFTWGYLGEPLLTLVIFWLIISFITGLIPLLLCYVRYKFYATNIVPLQIGRTLLGIANGTE